MTFKTISGSENATCDDDHSRQVSAQQFDCLSRISVRAWIRHDSLAGDAVCVQPTHVRTNACKTLAGNFIVTLLTNAHALQSQRSLQMVWPWLCVCGCAANGNT